MVSSFGFIADRENDMLTSNVKYGINNGLFKVSASYNRLLNDGTSSTTNGELALSFGTAVSDKTKHFKLSELTGSVNHNIEFGNGSVFCTLGGGADLSYCHTYDQDYRLGTDVGPHFTVVGTDTGYKLDGTYGLHVVNKSEAPENRYSKINASVFANTGIGVNLTPESQAVLYGGVKQELTNSHNTAATVGIAYSKDMTIFEADAALSIGAGYTKNFNNNSSMNIENHSGAFVQLGVGIHF